MTLVDSIIAAHAEQVEVEPKQIVSVSVDFVYSQDGNTPTLARLFREGGFRQVFDPERVAFFFDHAVLSPTWEMSDRIQDALVFARSTGAKIYSMGSGISHVVALEAGIFQPGGIVVGADSHTCTAGALGCLGLGFGASDVLAAMVTGKTWLQVPETVRLDVQGQPLARTQPKDVLLYALAHFGMEPFSNRVVEWYGGWVNLLSKDQGATIANFATDLGAVCSFMPERLRQTVDLHSDRYFARLRLDIEDLPPQVARPHSPDRVVPLDDCAGERIDFVFIGSCSNSYLEDMRQAAEQMEGFQVHPQVQCVITPGSRKLYLQALQEGLIEKFLRAGALVTPAGCGCCAGTQGSIPSSHSRVVATINRNFRGRMGNKDSAIWLASPVVAAKTAVLGRIPSVEDLG